jgi:alanine racemase
MRTLRNLPSQPRRDAWLEVNLGAIEHNARAIRKLIPKHVNLMAIVKADAYGHGAAMILPTLEASGVSMAGVASIDEAIQLRQAGLKLPILVIGVAPDWAFQFAADYDIQLTIFAQHHLESLRKAYQQDQIPFQVHIKVDTGMHRIGIPWKKAAEFILQCQSLPYLEVKGIFSHLADSHDPELSALQVHNAGFQTHDWFQSQSGRCGVFFVPEKSNSQPNQSQQVFTVVFQALVSRIVF